ncbi:hypothetical protein AB0P45_22260 [Streptomyces niveus]|uniref:hypothetical protein n=1 Tax=Streptomyces niveus TaxID=193462 RepID=UPI00342E8FA1
MRLDQARGRSGGYQQIFSKRIDRLPAKPCAGAVNRSIVADALPDARTADERGKITDSVNNQFTFWCYVSTGESIISGEAQSDFATEEGWRESYSSRVDGDLVSVSAGEVKVIALDNLASVYIPCTPPRQAEYEVERTHSLVSDVRTIGESRVQGIALRQVLMDFAYQLTKHAYEVGKCKEARDFPMSFPGSEPISAVIPFGSVRVFAGRSRRQPFPASADGLLVALLPDHLAGRRARRGDRTDRIDAVPYSDRRRRRSGRRHGGEPRMHSSAQLGRGRRHLRSSFRINRLIWNDEINQ